VKQITKEVEKRIRAFVKKGAGAVKENPTEEEYDDGCETPESFKEDTIEVFGELVEDEDDIEDIFWDEFDKHYTNGKGPNNIVTYERIPECSEHLSGFDPFLNVAPKALAILFGKPDAGDDHKISGRYTFETPNDGLIQIFDFKATTLYECEYPRPSEFWEQTTPHSFCLSGDSLGSEKIRSFQIWINKQAKSIDLEDFKGD